MDKVPVSLWYVHSPPYCLHSLDTREHQSLSLPTLYPHREGGTQPAVLGACWGRSVHEGFVCCCLGDVSVCVCVCVLGGGERGEGGS